MESFSEELDEVINKSTPLGDWEILGLRAYKVPNETATTFNIINQETQDITTTEILKLPIMMILLELKFHMAIINLFKKSFPQFK